MINRIRAWPLQAKLIVITWVSIMLALLVAGPVIIALVRSSLVSEVDNQLERAGRDVAQSAADELVTGTSDDDTYLPSDYFVEFYFSGTVTALQSGSAPSARGHRPALGSLIAEEGEVGPSTVGSTAGSTSWRAIVLPVQVRTPSAVSHGKVAVALPLTAADATTDRAIAVFLTVGIAVLVLSSAVSWYAVRRALRPLREVEETALKIADGDFTLRIPPAPMDTEVGRLGFALNTMLSHIEEAFAQRETSEQRLRHFVADASHELRTPLATVRGFAELYRQGGIPNEEVAPTMARIETEARRLGDLVADLLTLARLDNKNVAGQEKTSVNLTDLVRDAVRDAGALDATREITVQGLQAPAPAAGESGTGERDAGGNVENAVPEPPEVYVAGYEGQLRQVLSNLMGNVVHYTPEGSPVEIILGHADPKTALLDIRDHGPGVQVEDLERIFDRFTRVDAHRARAEGGTGLGLAIVAAIMGAHHGSVRAVETPGGGLTVQLRLPLGDGAPGVADSSLDPQDD